MRANEKGRSLHEYRIFETDQFARDLKGIARAGHQDVVRKLRTVVYPQLIRHPHFGPHIRTLKNYAPETWRCRIGAWRFFHEIDDDERTVFTIAAAHRGSAY
jgi:mRNA-degrading endonuclease RelE of RelBE toxin-antitoxin system